MNKVISIVLLTISILFPSYSQAFFEDDDLLVVEIGVEEYLDDVVNTLEITAKDSVIIKSVLLNRGVCQLSGNLPQMISYGKTLKLFIIGECTPLEATIKTNKGEMVYTFR